MKQDYIGKKSIDLHSILIQVHDYVAPFPLEKGMSHSLNRGNYVL